MILEAHLIMRFRTAVTIATFFLLCFTISVWAVPVPAEAAPLPNTREPNSVSGIITKLSGSQFTLSLKQNQGFGTLEFRIESITRMEGKLAVGSRTRVEYSPEGRQLVATHVLVLPASGIHL
jgi:hypothetical protein